MNASLWQALKRELKIFIHMPVHYHLCMISLLIRLDRKINY